MSPLLLPAATVADPTVIGPGETALFWFVAPLVVLAALALVFAKKAVYAAVAMVFVMIGLAVFYIAQDAMFLGVVQIVVYTGAIMMLFLFVLMLLGVDVAESVVETIRGHRWIAAIFGAGVLVGLTGIVIGAFTRPMAGLQAANAETNPVGVATVLFANYPFAMELTGALLIVAALAAMTLTHMDRVGRKVTQKDVADAKMAGWAERGSRIGQLAIPGVYARSNRVTVPALGPGGLPIEDSVPQVLRIRGQEQAIAEVAPDAEAQAQREVEIPLSGLPGMPGEGAPDYEAAAAEPRPALEGRSGVEAPTDGGGASPAAGALTSGTDAPAGTAPTEKEEEQ